MLLLLYIVSVLICLSSLKPAGMNVFKILLSLLGAIIPVVNSVIALYHSAVFLRDWGTQK